MGGYKFLFDLFARIGVVKVLYNHFKIKDPALQRLFLWLT